MIYLLGTGLGARAGLGTAALAGAAPAAASTAGPPTQSECFSLAQPSNIH